MLNDSEILLIGLVATLIVLLLATVLIATIVISQNRRKRHEQEVKDIAQKTEMEITKARMEATQNIMQGIGRELHDNVGQLLTASQLGMMRMMEEDESSSEQLKSLVEYLEEGISEVNRLGRTLNVEYWKNKSLFEAIVEESARLERMGFAQVLVESDAEHDELPNDERTVLYRLFQEVIQNTLKHAQATEIQIHLKDQPFEMRVGDNGNGFDRSRANEGTGLMNIGKRSELIGMEARLETSPGKGTSWSFKKKADQ